MEQGILRSEGEAGAERRNSAEKLNLGGKDVVAGVDAPRDGPPLKVVESSNTEDPIAEGIHQSPGKPCDLGGMSPEPNLFDKGVFLSHKVASPAGNCNSTGTSAYKEFPTSQEVDWCPLRGKFRLVEYLGGQMVASWRRISGSMEIDLSF